MIRFALIAAALIGAAAGPARADDDAIKKDVKKLVEKMRDATLKDDYETIIDLTHPKVVKEMGGRDKAVDAAKQIMKELRAKGFKVTSFAAGEPGDPVRGAKELYVLVPTSMEMTTPKGKLKGTGYLLGISADGGKTWRFVDGAAGPDRTRQQFPDLPKSLVLPKTEYKLVKD